MVRVSVGLEDVNDLIEDFEQALANAPNGANIWAALARTYAMLGWWGYAPPSESFSKAKVAAERALSLDATLSEAQVALGMVRFLFDWDWQAQNRLTNAPSN